MRPLGSICKKYEFSYLYKYGHVGTQNDPLNEYNHILIRYFIYIIKITELLGFEVLKMTAI